MARAGYSFETDMANFVRENLRDHQQVRSKGTPAFSDPPLVTQTTTIIKDSPLPAPVRTAIGGALIGGGGIHPWEVLVADGNGGLVASIATDSLFFKNFTDWTTTPIIGYSETTGATANVALGAHISIKLSMDENMELASVELDVGNLEDIGATLDGDYYVLAQETPDYAETQYIPIARIVDDGEGNPKVIQYIRNHIRLGIIAADGLLLYHPIAS